jgi:micrococcal nuclease
MPHRKGLCRAALAIALVGAAAATLPALAAAATLVGTVSREVDGDTIHVRVRGFDDTVRLVGIDTPETKRPGTPVQCFGPAASERTARILPPGTPVRLETDPTQDTRDRYGRLLAYVYKPGRSGASGSVNYALVATGYAKVDVYAGIPFHYAPAFQRAQSRARSGGLGLWAPPCRGNTTQPAAQAQQRRARPAAAGGSCNPNYTPCVPNSPTDLDCKDVGRAVVVVVGSDPYRLDGDGDGRGCESYG